MAKIRDLGIMSVGYEKGPSTCSETCKDNTAQCEPNSGCVQGSPAPSGYRGLTDGAIMQLKQQLQNMR